MLIAFCILYLTYWPRYTAGAIWTRSTSTGPSTNELHQRIKSENALIQEGFDDLFPNHAALSQTAIKPDCFRQATGYMQQRCADLDRLEEDKISFAISMTLCELETAHLSPPMECRSARRNPAATPAGRRHCVEALARSAQSWSSYSGYFRESTRICYAYQHLNDIDIAKNTYQNITAEKLRLVQFLLRREQNFEKKDEQLSASIMSMREILNELHTFPGILDSVAANMANVSRDIMQSMIARFDEALIQLSRRQSERQAHALLEVNAGISRLLAKQANSWESTIKTLGNELSYHSEALLQRIQLHDQELGHVMNRVHGQWDELIGGISTLRLSVSQTSQAADLVGGQLQAHLKEAAAAYEIQLAAAENAEQLASALGNLTFTTQEELQLISNATRSIKENLPAPLWQGAPIWYSVVLNVFRAAGRGDLPTYRQISENPVFRIAMIAGHMVWGTAWFLLSAMMRVVTPATVFTPQVEEALRKYKIGTLL